MSKKGVSQKQVEAIKEYSRQGLTANEIQRRLSQEGLGIRRQILLEYVREFRGKAPPVNPSKNIPHKYAKASGAKIVSGHLYPSTERKTALEGKKIAVYGYAITNRQKKPYSARFEFYGSGKNLNEAVRLAHDGIVPRKEWAFVTCYAKDFLKNPDIFGENGEWTDKPDIESERWA